MKIFKKSNQINKFLLSQKSVGFVPTMGALHKGHISLIKKSKSVCKKTVVSIFLNPKQFNNKKDLKKYPSNLKKDLRICKKNKVDYLYVPNFKEVYSWKTKKKIYPKIKNIMENIHRKGHFKGVLNVIEKLLDIVPSHKLFLGKKDYQQLRIIADYIRINKIPTKVIECDTVREKNGLALSSRNARLNLREINFASKVYQFIKKYKNNYLGKKFNKKVILNFLNNNHIKYDYVENCNFNNLSRSKSINKHSKIFIAFYISKIRLIDNI